MLTDAVKNWVRTWSSRLIRKLQIRGRADTGYYGVDNSGADPSDGDVGMTVQRYQLYGLTSEPPSGTECVVLAVNGGATNRVAVAELPQNVPAIEADEVLLWAKAGQRILLTRDGDIVVTPAAGRKVLLGSATGTDPVVLKSELNSLLSTVRTWLNGHIHPTPSGASSAASTPIGSLSVSGSSNTEAKT